MRLINKLNSDPRQKAVLTGNLGQRIIMNLRYLPTQKMWAADFQLDDFILKGVSVLVSPNMLRGYHNILPFGITCQTLDGQDPRGIEDFETEYALLYLLSQEEVLEMEDEFFT